MWKRFAGELICPICGTDLELITFAESQRSIDPEYQELADETELDSTEIDISVDQGLLTCANCETKYPIWNGLPILLNYPTRSHEIFSKEFAKEISSQVEDRFKFPQQEPVVGEEHVGQSFSKEWSDYEYDGIIWELDYDDHEARLLAEMGPLKNTRAKKFLEVGCGIGITTGHAQKNYHVDAVGMDLSSAPTGAIRHFQNNPFLHFVQASAFALPFRPASFDLIYSRGVLHHTFSTKAAFERIAPLCRHSGTVYLWVYGPGSIKSSPLRLGLYGMECLLRPILSSRASSTTTKVTLAPFALAYILFNRLRRLANRRIQPLSFSKAMHAARDRFTPRFAHRHDSDEVTTWFRDGGFENIEVVDWRDVPPADHADFGRNTAVRGVKA